MAELLNKIPRFFQSPQKLFNLRNDELCEFSEFQREEEVLSMCHFFDNREI